uniref:DDE Tnp4 domain-containing protein n=1 Tax=Sipha flava TaxID=143950 RepID=A0A2S2QBW9_9HEMI
MRPFPEKTTTKDDAKDNYNYRLSRARMVVECSFGSISSKFRILQKPIETNVENAVYIVKAITLLHNIMYDLESINDTEVRLFQDSYRNTPRILQNDFQKRLNASSRAATQVKENFKLYFEQHPIQRM